MVGLLRRSGLWLGLLVGLLAAGPLPACPFCSLQGQTLTGELNLANMVLYVRVNPTGPTSDQGARGSTTDLIIDAVVKNHEYLKDRKAITLHQAFFLVQPEKYRFLFFFDFSKGVDPYRWVQLKADSDVVSYLKGALAVKDEKPGKRLRFFFDYLNHPDIEIATDAYKEFANTSYPDYKDLAARLPADQLARWLRDPRTPVNRFGLYGSTLGHCGKSEHATFLRGLLDNDRQRVSPGLDGILAGYILLEPREGWEYLRGILKDPFSKFDARFAARRVVEFFWDYRSDVIAKKELAEALALLLDTDADLAIADFRKWQCWDMTDRILALRHKGVYTSNIVRRSILFYALSAKDSEAAQKYVAEQRLKDPDGVKKAEEQLKMERTLLSTPPK